MKAALSRDFQMESPSRRDNGTFGNLARFDTQRPIGQLKCRFNSFTRKRLENDSLLGVQVWHTRYELDAVRGR